MTYQRKPQLVNCFRLTLDLDLWPEWLNQSEDFSYYDGIWKADGVPVDTDDWIIEDYGRLFVFDDESFHVVFEEVR